MSANSLGASPTPGALQGLVLLLPITLAVMGIAVLVPIVPQLMIRFASVPHHEYLIQGGVLTLPALCTALFSPLAGWLSDRIGRRRLLITAMIVYGFVGIAPLVLDDLWAIIASRFGVGVCEAAVMTISTTLISDYFRGAARERWLAAQTAVASLSSMVLITVGGLLGAAYGWRGPFGVYVISLLLAAGVWLYTWEPSVAANESETDRLSSGAVVFPWARMAGICGITLFAAVMFYTIATQSGLALAALGVQDPARVGMLTMIASLGVPLGTVLFRILARLPIGTLLGLELMLIGGGFCAMGKATGPWPFVVAAGINQLGCGMILPTLLTWATRGLAFEIRGRGTGLWQATFAIGQFLNGLIVTFLAKSLGGLLPALLTLGLANFLAAGLAFASRIRSGSLAATPSARHQPR